MLHTGHCWLMGEGWSTVVMVSIENYLWYLFVVHVVASTLPCKCRRSKCVKFVNLFRLTKLWCLYAQCLPVLSVSLDETLLTSRILTDQSSALCILHLVLDCKWVAMLSDVQTLDQGWLLPRFLSELPVLSILIVQCIAFPLSGRKFFHHSKCSPVSIFVQFA